VKLKSTLDTKAMTKKSTLVRRACLFAGASALMLFAGSQFDASAQRDPFAKASYMKKPEPRNPNALAKGASAKVPGTAPSFGPPAIDARIDYYKRLREEAAANCQPLPKVTSVLTLSELNVTGIFKTPRGYAAMVEATPIKLSYTIYPGEKFFDGQLVAVEDNKLVFRRVTKTAPGKFVSSVENKPLQTYSTRAQIEGTAPAQGSEKTTVAVLPTQVPNAGPGPVVSPLDEMDKVPAADDKSAKPKKSSKRPQRAAKGN
jgi:hypothetical protein